MNNSTIFTKAHKIARNTVRIVGDYMVAFKLALKAVYDSLKTSSSVHNDKDIMQAFSPVINGNVLTFDCGVFHGISSLVSLHKSWIEQRGFKGALLEELRLYKGSDKGDRIQTILTKIEKM